MSMPIKLGGENRSNPESQRYSYMLRGNLNAAPTEEVNFGRDSDLPSLLPANRQIYRQNAPLRGGRPQEKGQEVLENTCKIQPSERRCA